MPIVSMVCGALLIAISVLSYNDAEVKSFTIWIPALIGSILALCGAVALKESLLKHAMHAAAAVGLLAGVAVGGRWAQQWFAGTDLGKPAMVASAKTALICFVFVAMCVNSFIQVRRRRRAEAAKA